MKKVKVNGKEYEVPEGYELIIKGDEVIIQEKKTQANMILMR